MENSIRIAADMIALESMNPSQLLNALPNRLPGFLKDVKNSVVNVFSGSFWNQRGLIDVKKTNRLIQDLNYMTLAEQEIFIPAGLSVPLIEYLRALNNASTLTEALISETLQPTLNWLAMLLTKPENLASVRAVPQDSGIVFHDLKKHQLALAKCLEDRRKISKGAFKKVFKRNADMLECATVVNQLNQALVSVDKDNVTELVDEIIKAFDTILIRMKTNPNEYKLSGPVMGVMAKVALNLAEEIEFYGAHAHKVQEATETFKLTVDKLDSVYRDQ